MKLYLRSFPCSPLYLTADTFHVFIAYNRRIKSTYTPAKAITAQLFSSTAQDAVIDRRNLACYTRRGQNRPWVLGTVIYGVKNIRLKAGFKFSLALQHPNNRLENVMFLFVPLQLNGNKKLLGRKNIGGAFAHLVHSKLRL